MNIGLVDMKFPGWKDNKFMRIQHMVPISGLVMSPSAHTIQQDIIGTTQWALPVMEFGLWEVADMANKQRFGESLPSQLADQDLPGDIDLFFALEAIFDFRNRHKQCGM